MKFRKKPVVIDAVQWTGLNVDEILRFCETGASLRRVDYPSPNGGRIIGGCLVIETREDGPNREAKHVADPRDWIIKGVKGEFYPCKPDIFAATYEPAE